MDIILEKCIFQNIKKVENLAFVIEYILQV